MMLVYLSGPYTANDTGTVDEHIEQAAQVAAELWRIGHAVICPHTNTSRFEERLPDVSWERYIQGDLTMISVCDAMVMLPGWESSRGAMLEWDYATSLKIPIYTWPDYPPLHPTELRCPDQVKAFREIVGQMYRTHLEKNADYSPANILATGEIGLVTRLWDKVARLMNLVGFRFEIEEAGQFTGAREPRHEAVDDTLMDAAVYAVIGLLLRRDAWGK